MSSVDRSNGFGPPPSPSQTRTSPGSEGTADFQREVDLHKQSERGAKGRRPAKADGDVDRFTEIGDAERLDASRRIKRDRKPLGSRVRSPFDEPDEDEEDEERQ